MTFIHLFIYPFICGIIAAGSLFAVYKRDYWLVVLALISFFAMVLLTLTTHINYTGYMI